MSTTSFVGFKPGWLSCTFRALLDACSAKPLPAKLRGIPLELEPLLRVLYRGQLPEIVAPSPMQSLPQATDDSRALVGFSGGKDSLAAALRLRRMGLEVTLLYMKGINRAYPHEEAAAVELAVALGFPLRIIQVKQAGRCAYIENPVKNQFILAVMLDYGLRSGTRNYCQGGLACDHADELNFEAGYSDAEEMFRAAAEFFQLAAPGFTYHLGLLQNDTDALLEVLQTAPEALPLISSCMMTARFKAKLAHGNERKYGLRLMPGRCGSCYKCASEYLHMALAGAAPMNRPYANHCVEVMQKALQQTIGTGRRYSRAEALGEFIDPSRLPFGGLL